MVVQMLLEPDLRQDADDHINVIINLLGALNHRLSNSIVLLSRPAQ